MCATKKTHLIIVPCHSVWKHDIIHNSSINLGHLAEHWFLAPFQFEGNDHLAFIKHGLKAIQTALHANSNESIVVFSGSQTKKQARCMSEAQSYYLLIHRLISKFQDYEFNIQEVFEDEFIIACLQDIINTLFKKKLTVDTFFLSSVATEEFALDSFENLLFSIYRFRQLAMDYPKKITIVGFGFKETRFLQYHAKAIDYPKQCINYIAIDPVPPNYTAEQLEGYYSELKVLEQRNAIQLFELDMYGTREALYGKKLSRNPFMRYPAYQDVSLFDLSNITGEDEEFFNKYINGIMPWSVNRVLLNDS